MAMIIACKSTFSVFVERTRRCRINQKWKSFDKTHHIINGSLFLTHSSTSEWRSARRHNPNLTRFIFREISFKVFWTECKTHSACGALTSALPLTLAWKPIMRGNNDDDVFFHSSVISSAWRFILDWYQAAELLRVVFFCVCSFSLNFSPFSS